MTKTDELTDDISALLQFCSIDKEIDFSLIHWRDSLIHLGIKHGIGAWCYYRIKNAKPGSHLDEDIIKLWKQQYFQTTLANQHKIQVYNKIQKLFAGKGIPVIALKGMALATTVYPDEGLRPMGDIDLLVPEGEGPRALNLLLKAGAQQGYVPRSALHEKVHAHMRAVNFMGVLVEIHQRLFSLGNPFHQSIDYFKSTSSGALNSQEIQVLDDGMLFYHLAAHAASNIYKGGLRLGWLVDMALIRARQDDTDGFTRTVLEHNRKMRHEIQGMMDVVSLLTPQQKSHSLQNRAVIWTQIVEGVRKRHDIRRHKLINIREIIQTPGIANKMQLFWREIFPESAYMQKHYDGISSHLWRLYIRRLLRF